MTGKTSENNILANKPTTVEQIKTLNINNKAKSPSRPNSFTNQVKKFYEIAYKTTSTGIARPKRQLHHK